MAVIVISIVSVFLITACFNYQIIIKQSFMCNFAKNLKSKSYFKIPQFKPIIRKKIIDKHTMLTNYNEYSFSLWESILYISQASAVLFLIGYLFFRNPVLSSALCLLSFFYLPIKKKNIIRKRKTELEIQFKDMLQSLSASLSAGRSAEGAFHEALNDLKLIYPYDNYPIIQELNIIIKKIGINEPIEKALFDFALRSGIDDIKNFCDIFTICKNTGGNLVEVIRNTAEVINQKIEIKSEIDIIITEKKLGQKIMSIMPFGLMLLISTGSPDYVAILFTPKGNLVMFIVLAILAASYFIGVKIMDIEI